MRYSRFPMRSSSTIKTAPPPEGLAAIGDSAAANLRYIRDTIEAAHAFTLVPGRGCILMGGIALLAAVLDALPRLAPYWLTIWLSAAVFAGAVALYEMAEKARRQGVSLRRTVAFRFFMTLAPSFVAGGILTAALLGEVGRDVISGVWMLSYGAGIAASGPFSIPVVLIAGCAFIGLGAVTLTAPTSWVPALLGLGFGGIHIVLGIIVVRRHGG